MILKNTTKGNRKLQDHQGKWFTLQPNETIDLENPKYSSNDFHIVETKKQALAGLKKKTQKRRKKINGTRYME